MTSHHELSINHNSAVPLHTQLRRQFRSRIVSGRWAPGTRLPSESRLQRELNVSRNTVRQALREMESEGLIERIPGRGTFVARELPREQERCLVAIVISSFDSQLDVLSGAERVARDNECLFVFYNHQGNYHEERRILARLVEQGVSGVLLWSCAPTGTPLPSLQGQGASLLPVVMLDRNPSGLPADFVTSDNVAGGGMAVRHLQQLGHRRIVCLSHDRDDLVPVDERIQGYRAAMATAGHAESAATWILPTGGELTLPATLRTSNNPESITMRTLGRRLQEERPEAIFAINDHMALLALRAAQGLGLRVPGDLSIVGYDNADYGAAFTPPLTTVEQSYETMGRRAMELLLERIAGLTAPPHTVRVPVTLYERATAGRPAGRT